MNEHLIKYAITPRILRAGEEQTVTVTPLDASTVFYDDIDYTVRIVAEREWKDSPVVKEEILRARDGVLRFSFTPYGEQPFAVTISRERSDAHQEAPRYRYWAGLKEREYKGFSFAVYSLEKDLYGLRPFKGDLHVHTIGSDGGESGPMVAAQYRKQGYDFIAITDHYTLAPSVETAAFMETADPSMTVFHGEEVHKYGHGALHVVSFAPKSSVNAVIQADPDAVTAQVTAIAEGLTDVAEEHRLDLAYYMWTFAAVREAGGISIFPHPYWRLGTGNYNLRGAVAEEILNRGLPDVFEVLGGVDPVNKRLQVTLWNDTRAKGKSVPVVASSDSHGALVPTGTWFNSVFTVVLAPSAAAIPEAVLQGRTVAVENSGEKNLYGELRLSRFVWFLLDHYYGERIPLCNAAGQALLRHIQGKSGQKELIALLEKEVADYDTAFFGY